MWGGQYCCWGAPLPEGESQNPESGGHWFSLGGGRMLGRGQSASASEHSPHPTSFQRDPPPGVRGHKVNAYNRLIIDTNFQFQYHQRVHMPFIPVYLGNASACTCTI